MLIGTPNEDNYSGSLTSLSMVSERKSRIKGGKCASYVVLDDATANVHLYYDVLLLIQMRFGLVSEHWTLQHVQCFLVDRWIRRKEYTLA